ncbi:Docking protein 3 [Fasciola gigantica]|uniref:Docking protein 3 n=1 Tax=Fasciola gigantica TaxID=46835 RepID=A0A504Y4D5_FASGI|nr:Docking protein 3 [Fasciola gigantica]
MNLSGRFYVRSNYIRAAKDNWVLCEVRLLTDDVDTFLCIKSLSLSGSGDPEDLIADGSMNEMKSRSYFDKKGKSTNFTALCNLSEYKSCSVRTVTVNGRDSFAIRLVPSGVIGNKQLLIASVDENEITTWLSICKSSIGKKSKQSKDNISTAGTLSKAGSFLSLKPITSNFDADFDEALLDNEVYEAYSSEDKIPALLEEAGDWIKLRLNQPECYLRLTEERLEVLDAITQKPVQWFPYLLIRRFGAANGVLRVDAGRRCSTGDGRFFFRCSPPNGQPVDMLVTQIRQLALEAKQRLKRTQLASSNLELSDRMQPRNVLFDTSDALGDNGTPDADKEHQFAGTLPRARSKRGKPALHPPLDRTVRVNGFTEQPAPKATPEPSDDPDVPKFDTGQDECEIVRATPVKATKSPADSPTSPNNNLYDNLPRSPRKGARLPGAVNVLPLPVRAKVKDSNGRSTRDHSHDSRFSRSPRPNGVTSESTENETPPVVIPRPASVPRAQQSIAPTNQKHNSTSLAGKYATTPHGNGDEDAPPPGPAPAPPVVVSAPGTTVQSEKKGLSQTQQNNSTRTQTSFPSDRPKQLGSVELVKPSAATSSTAVATKWKTSNSTPPNPTRPTQSDMHGGSVAKSTVTSPTSDTASTNNANTKQNGVTAGTQVNNFSPTVVMRVPSFTSPKSPAGSTAHSVNTPASPSDSSQPKHTDPYPVPLSRVLNPKISSASVYLRGPHPTTAKKETIHSTQAHISPTPSVSAMVNRINSAEWHPPSTSTSSSAAASVPPSSSRVVQKTEPIARNSSLNQPRSANGVDAQKDTDDPKNYLSELDSVIKELCEANEAAVQATREAARRRRQLGWPSSRNETAITSNGRQFANT